MSVKDNTTVVVLILLIIAILAFGPLVSIWALNTLFPVLAIPYNLATWFATLWLFGFIAYKGKK